MKRLCLLLFLATAFADSPAPVPRFVDVSKKAGLTTIVVSGDAEKKYLIESTGGGLAVLDYDNDGYMDLFIVNGSTIADTVSGKNSYRSALYRNNGDGTFTEVTNAAGLVNRGWGKGALAADFDGDGWPDLYIVNFGPNILYLNNRDGTFRDATKEAGVGDPRWSAGAAAADYDGDGHLDLFVVNYLDYDLRNLPTEGKFCSYQNIPVACGPRGLKGAGNTLYRNNGDGTFTDVSVQAGVSDPEGTYGLGAAWGDYDNDGRIDLFVANDNTPNFLYRNNGDGTFSEVAIEAGVAFSEDGREQACMGVEFEDLDNDGLLDIMVTNFSDDYNTLYRNAGGGLFRDDSYRAGLVSDSWRDLSWGVAFVDVNNDGWKDVIVANGHIYPQVDNAGVNTSYRQKNKLYLNTGAPKLMSAGPAAGSGFQAAKSYRGLAVADFNNDGQTDLALIALDEPVVLLMNQGVPSRNWILVHLKGAGKNTFGVGARITVKAGGLTQIREVKAGSSFASSSDPRAHFGLGASEVIDELTVKWPSGKVTRLESVPTNRILTVHEEPPVSSKAR